jgi:HEAT repeat protein
LEEELAHATADVIKIRLADAIEHLHPTGRHIPVLIQCLETADFWDDRAEAARKLSRYNRPEVLEALFEAIMDPDYLVRYHACDSLLALHGLDPDIANYGDIFANILSDSSHAQHRDAQEQLRTLFG